MKISHLLACFALFAATSTASALDRNLSKSKGGSKASKVDVCRRYRYRHRRSRSKGGSTTDCTQKMATAIHKGKGRTPHPHRPHHHSPVKYVDALDKPPTRAPHHNAHPTPPAPIPAKVPTPVPATAESDACKDAKVLSANGHKYVLPVNPDMDVIQGDWGDAEEWAKNLTCCNVPGHLVTISSASEEAFVGQLLLDTKGAFYAAPNQSWIGLHAYDYTNNSTIAGFTWSNGEVYDWKAYPGFADGAPVEYPKGQADVCLKWFDESQPRTAWFNGQLNCAVIMGYVVEFDCTSL